MKTTLILISLAMFHGAFALCPGGEGNNACSGHGSCGQYDKCTCYRNWQGVSCNERICPFSPAWADENAQSNRILGGGIRDGHTYKECGGKGICDRSTGQCECFAAFGGKGCSRMLCPNSCSGHGTCEYLDTVASSYNDWDAHRIQICQCDPGYEGHDCSKRKCKPGDDPVTHFTETSAPYGRETQTIAVTADAGEFILKYTDWRGETWKTWAIPHDATARYVEEALRALPNHAMAGVTVSKTSADWYVTFAGTDLSGDQPSLSSEIDGCDVAGCQPYYSKLTHTSLTASVTLTEKPVFCCMLQRPL